MARRCCVWGLTLLVLAGALDSSMGAATVMNREDAHGKGASVPRNKIAAMNGHGPGGGQFGGRERFGGPQGPPLALVGVAHIAEGGRER